MRTGEATLDAATDILAAAPLLRASAISCAGSKQRESWLCGLVVALRTQISVSITDSDPWRVVETLTLDKHHVMIMTQICGTDELLALVWLSEMMVM